MLEAFLAKNAGPQRTLRAGFLFYFLFFIFYFVCVCGKGWVEFGYIVFGLNGV